jgi:hypothetical protein
LTVFLARKGTILMQELGVKAASGQRNTDLLLPLPDEEFLAR